jgi:serine/threonine protein kinase
MQFKDRYRYNPEKDLLGKGGFAKVFMAYDTLLERPVALKFFTAETQQRYTILEEIKRVIQLNHPNVVRYYDVTEYDTNSIHGTPIKIQVGIMEYINGGEVKDFLAKNKDQATLNKMLDDILRGIAYLHKSNIIHRDLKPQNILVQVNDGDAVAKITDFGISKVMNSGGTATVGLVGTLDYMAPEQFDLKKYGEAESITQKVDLWAFGALAFELITGEKLLNSGSDGVSEKAVSYLLNADIEERIKYAPKEYHPLLKACLVKQAASRIGSAKELRSLLPGTTTTVADVQPSPIKRQTTTSSKSSFKKYVIGTLALLFLAAAVLWWLNRDVKESVVAKAPLKTDTVVTDMAKPIVKDSAPISPPVVISEPQPNPEQPRYFIIDATTNAMASLIVNNRPLGGFEINKAKRITLDAGNHVIKVVGANPADIIERNYTIKPGQLGTKRAEFFDLVQLIKDREKKEAEEKLKNCLKCKGTGVEEYVVENPCRTCLGRKIATQPCQVPNCTAGKVGNYCYECKGNSIWRDSNGNIQRCAVCKGIGYLYEDCKSCENGFVKAPCAPCKASGVVLGKRTCLH